MCSYFKDSGIHMQCLGCYDNQPTHLRSTIVIVDIRSDKIWIYLMESNYNYGYDPHLNETSFENPKIVIFKSALCLMYAQNPDALEELIRNNESDAPFTENMKTFYGDIINTVMNPQSYVLK
jgi:hypothetical protein